MYMEIGSPQMLQMDSRLSKKAGWADVVVMCTMLSAFLPKIVISDGVNIFFPEIFLLIGLLVFSPRQLVFFKEQRLLLYIFLSMLFFSMMSVLTQGDVGSIMRSFKEILYIPIIYWASKINNKAKILKRIIYFGIIAYAVNIAFYVSSFSIENTIWSGAEALSSGMSNRGFSFSSFKIVQLKGLAHGIWGSYCVLVFILAVSLLEVKLISKKLFFLVSALFLVNIGISVSRESILILVIVLLLYLILPQKSIAIKFYILIAIAAFIGLMVTFGDTFPLVQKLLYTADSVSSSGSEGNLQIRLNTWTAYWDFLSDNLIYFFIGFGISPDSFFAHVKPYTVKEIVAGPESALVYLQAYGGLFSTITMQALIVVAANRLNRNCPFRLLKYFFVGLLIANLLSGVSMFSDLLYAHLCLIYGLTVVNKDEVKSHPYFGQS